MLIFVAALAASSAAFHCSPAASPAALVRSGGRRSTAQTAVLQDVGVALANLDFPSMSGPATLPPEFAELARDMNAPAPHGPTISSIFLEAVGVSVILNAFLSFAPIIKAKITGEKLKPSAEAISRYLSKAPESNFGWLQADLRNPLPPLHELSIHEIGVHQGRQMFLCKPEEATKFVYVEVSKDFSEHYGETVYICSKKP